MRERIYEASEDAGNALGSLEEALLREQAGEIDSDEEDESVGAAMGRLESALMTLQDETYCD